MKTTLSILCCLVLVGCISSNKPEETFYYMGCPEKLLPPNRAVAMQISKEFWTNTDKKVWNSFSKKEWEEMMFLLARIPTDCIHERVRIVESAYHVVHNKDGKPAGVTISLYLGHDIPFVRSKDGHWRMLNISSR